MASQEELDRIRAVNDAVSLGDFIHRRVNSPRGLSKTAENSITREARRILTVVLGRRPTPDEVDAATSDADEWETLAQQINGQT